MDADLSAALAPETLAPPIARELGLSESTVTEVLRLLAAGDQPAFLARYRLEHIGKLSIRDLERVQARALAAVAFEFKRQQLRAELMTTPQWNDELGELVVTASHPVELDDAKVGGRKRKRGGAVGKARSRGLGVLASHLWACGSEGRLTGDAPVVPDADPVELAKEHPGQPPAAKPKRKRKRKKKNAAAANEGSEAVTQAAPAGDSANADADSSAALQAPRGEAAADAEQAQPGEENNAALAEGESADAARSEQGGAADAVPAQPSAPTEAAPAEDAGVPDATQARQSDSTEAAPAEDAGALDATQARQNDSTEAAPAEDAGASDATQAQPSEAAEATPAEDGGASDTTQAQQDAPAEAAPIEASGDEGASETAASGDEAAQASPEANEPPAPPPPPPTPEQNLTTARLIVGDDALSVPVVQRRLRSLLLERGQLKGTLVPGKKDKGGRYAKLAERPEPIAKANPSHVLGLFRGEREGALQVRLELDTESFDAACIELLGIDPERPCGKQLQIAMREAWDGPSGRSIRDGARKILKQRVDRRAIAEFCEAYRALLMAPAFGRRPVMAIDPGFAPGCRVVVLDATGSVIAREDVFPLQPKLQAPQAKARLIELATEHKIEAIAVTNGNGGRDLERLCRELVRETEGLSAPVVTVDSDVAGIFASSPAGKQEFADGDASLRRAVSGGRRLQDPLAELGKLDARKLSLGQHQHEVAQEELRAALEQVLISCVNRLGVDPNTASVDELARVVGFSHSLAQAVVAYRTEHGPFRTRQALGAVAGVPGKTFEQSAGFLRIVDGDHALDQTVIHPERYEQVGTMAQQVGVTVGDLIGNGELVAKIEGDKLLGSPGMTGEPMGKPTLMGLLEELREPLGDPRPPFEAVEFDFSVEKFEDLKVGMELPGIVTHLTSFGAFVDVGLSQEALVHVSELVHGFISSPGEAVHVGQRVKGRVIEVTADRKRFSMSLRALLPKPEGRPSGGKRRRGNDDRDRGKGKGDRGRGPKGNRRGRQGDRGRGPGRGDGGKDRGNDRVLGFRLDLSDLAKQLDKG
ncbi:MAG: helix-hairpin-helix domain-containing protein [Myxococcota bacterium]